MYSICEKFFFVIDMQYNLKALLEDFTCLKGCCEVTNNTYIHLQ